MNPRRRSQGKVNKLRNIKIKLRVEIEVMEENQAAFPVLLGTGKYDAKTEEERVRRVTENSALIEKLKNTLDQRAEQELKVYQTKQALIKDKRDRALQTPLAYATLVKHLRYNKDTGEFHRIIKTPRHQEDTLASKPSRSASMHNVVRLNYVVYRADKLAFLYMTGEMPTQPIKHLNGLMFDDKWSNLELGPAPTTSATKSGVTGVCWNKQAKKWQATISYNKRQVLIGQFIHLDHAVKARYEAELKHNTQDATRPTSAALYMMNRLLT